MVIVVTTCLSNSGGVTHSRPLVERRTSFPAGKCDGLAQFPIAKDAGIGPQRLHRRCACLPVQERSPRLAEDLTCGMLLGETQLKLHCNNAVVQAPRY